jgi:hypothetical protein
MLRRFRIRGVVAVIAATTGVMMASGVQPAFADGSNRIIISGTSLSGAPASGTVSINSTTTFTPLNGAPTSGNLNVRVEVYTGQNVATYWNETAGATAGSCRSAQGAMTTLFGSAEYTIPYTPAGFVNNARALTITGTAPLTPPPTAVYAVTRYIEPANDSEVWSTCAYTPFVVLPPTTTTLPDSPSTTMFCPPVTPGCPGFDPNINLNNDPGWGFGITTPQRGLNYTLTENCDGTATVVVRNPAANAANTFVVDVDGQQATLGPRSNQTFTLGVGRPRAVRVRTTNTFTTPAGPFDAIAGNPLNSTVPATNCPTTTVEATTTTVAATTTVDSTTTSAATTTLVAETTTTTATPTAATPAGIAVPIPEPTTSTLVPATGASSTLQAVETTTPPTTTASTDAPESVKQVGAEVDNLALAAEADGLALTGSDTLRLLLVACGALVLGTAVSVFARRARARA